MAQEQSSDQQLEQLEMLLNTMKEQGGGVKTDMTNTTHRVPYPAIDPKRPELSQEGRTILMFVDSLSSAQCLSAIGLLGPRTGAGTGIGLAIAKAFTQSGALRIIITGRRAGILIDAQKELQAEAQQNGKTVEVLTRPFDITDKAAAAALWEDLKEQGIEVDVLVQNAARTTPAGGLGPLLESTVDDIWDVYETNLHGPLLMAAGFNKQNVGKYKNIVNVATQSIHQFRPEHNVISHLNPAYALSKNAGALLNQVIAEHADPENLQVVSFHPGIVHSADFASFGVTPDMLPFDDSALPGAAAVYLASPEAKFLHGRFVWASWDVNELQTGELRKRIDEDAEFLKIGMHGVKGDGNRKW